MGTSWATMDADRVHVRVVDPSETDNPVWDEGGPGEHPSLVIRSSNSDMADNALEIAGTLDGLGETVRRINRAYYAALDKALAAAPLPPAVTFDADALRRWLTTPAVPGGPPGFTRAVEIGVPQRFDNVNHHIGDLVDMVLVELLDDTETSAHPFRLAPDVNAVGAYALLDNDVYGGGLAVDAQMAGDIDSPTFDLSVKSYPFTWAELLTGAEQHSNGGTITMPGVDAVILAVSNIVGPINETVDNWRKHTRPIKAREGLAATLSEDEIECALRTLAALHNDEDPDDFSKRQLNVMARLGKQYTAEMFEEEATAGEPPTCILTGQSGENPDDCTTHEHKARAATLIWEQGELAEPETHRATSYNLPPQCTSAYYLAAPESDGRWTLALITSGPGGVCDLLLGVHANEYIAKQAAQEAENRTTN